MKSFANVKNDTSKLFQWMNFFYQKTLEQDNLIKKLELELSYVPKKPEDVKRIIDGYYSYENLTERIKLLDQKIDSFSIKKPVKRQFESEEIEQRVEKLEQQKTASMREKIVKKLTRNSKEYIKNQIFSYIRRYNQIGALQLKDMIVTEQDLCSKSSFYRILDEIEALDEVGIIKRGKEKYFLFKVKKNL
jgi:hypothetical protein